jgi:prevent-host-death family protein
MRRVALGAGETRVHSTSASDVGSRADVFQSAAPTRHSQLTGNYRSTKLSVAKFGADLATRSTSMKLTRDIHSLSTFKRDTAKLVRQMKKTKEPVVLTVNGKAALVVQDADGYQKLLDAKDRMEALEGIRRGLESMKRNAGKPAKEFFREFFAEKGISEHE